MGMFDNIHLNREDVAFRDRYVLSANNPEKAYETDYHGHPKYIKIYFTLVLLLLLTLIPNIVNLIAGEVIMPAVWWLVILIFALSAWKAFLVIGNFMHMKYEPVIIGGFIVFSLTLLGIFFGLIWADISKIYDPSTRTDITTTKTNKVQTYKVGDTTKSYQIIEIDSTKTTRGGTKIQRTKFDFASIDKHLNK